MKDQYANSDLPIQKLYDRYSGVFYRLLLGITGSPDDADEMLVCIFYNMRCEVPAFTQSGHTELGWLFCFTRDALKNAGYDASPLLSLQGIRSITNFSPVSAQEI